MDVRAYKVINTNRRKHFYENIISELKGKHNFPKNALCNVLKEYGNDIDFENRLKGYMYDNKATKYILWELNNTQEIINFAQTLNINISNQNIHFNDCDVDLYKELQKELKFCRR